MPNIPANRVAAIFAVIAGIAGALAPIIAELDTSSVAGMIGGLVLILATVDRFLKGSQAYDRLQAEANAAHRSALFGSGQVSISLSEDPEVDDVPADELPSDEEELAAPPPRSMGY